MSDPCIYCKGRGYYRMGYIKCDMEGIHDTRFDYTCVACKGTGLANPLDDSPVKEPSPCLYCPTLFQNKVN